MKFANVFRTPLWLLLEEIQAIQDMQGWRLVTVVGVQDENVTKVAGASCKLILFSIWVFFHGHLQFTGQQGKGEAFSSAHSLHHLHPLHRHVNISRAITAGSSPLHIASSRTRTGNL